MPRLLTALLTLCLALPAVNTQGQDAAANLGVARFDDNDRLLWPEDIERWVFVGSSLGMGYSQAEFDPGSPGMFQIVRMEPAAWEHFRETGEFADGSMFSLHFYGSQNKLSINRAGFVMGELSAAEIHLKDAERFPDGFNFYNFDPGQKAARAVPLPNGCVDCHTADGAYDGVFVQFYPLMQPYLPEQIQRHIANMDK